MALKVVNTESLDAVANAINAKSGTSGALQFPDGFVDAIEAIQAGGGEDLSTALSEQEELVAELKSVISRKANRKIEEKQIIFIDYDGTVLYSYTPEEVLALTELPSHTSTDELLTFDGWNWTLEELKDEINLIGLDFMQHHKMAVGATYNTVDDATYFFITVKGYDDYSRTVTLHGGISSGAVAKIDWGDGSELTSMTSTDALNTSSIAHIYANNGDYVIKIIVESGNIFLSYSANTAMGIFSTNLNYGYQLVVNKAYVGNARTIHQNSFSNMVNMKSVVLSNKCVTIKNGAFGNCYALKAIVMPKNWSPSTNASNYAFAQSASSLQVVSFPNKPLYVITNFLRDCISLRCAHLPLQTVVGSSKFDFYQCKNLETVIIANTEDERAAYECTRLKRAFIREGVTKLIYTFYNCVSLEELKMPSTIQSLADSVFYGCYTLRLIDFTACTSVPTLSSTSVFANVPSTCKILVPASLYDEWIAATNWSTSSIASRLVSVEV